MNHSKVSIFFLRERDVLQAVQEGMPCGALFRHFVRLELFAWFTSLRFACAAKSFECDVEEPTLNLTAWRAIAWHSNFCYCVFLRERDVLQDILEGVHGGAFYRHFVRLDLLFTAIHFASQARFFLFECGEDRPTFDSVTGHSRQWPDTAVFWKHESGNQMLRFRYDSQSELRGLLDLLHFRSSCGGRWGPETESEKGFIETRTFWLQRK